MGWSKCPHFYLSIFIEQFIHFSDHSVQLNDRIILSALQSWWAVLNRSLIYPPSCSTLNSHTLHPTHRNLSCPSCTWDNTPAMFSLLHPAVKMNGSPTRKSGDACILPSVNVIFNSMKSHSIISFHVNFSASLILFNWFISAEYWGQRFYSTWRIPGT